MRITDVLIRLVGASDPNCPNEANVLAYFEKKLPSHSRSRIERHFNSCVDCREVLAVLGRESDEAPARPTEEAINEQTNRVLAYIQNDERARTKPAQKARPAAGFYISYPKLATVGLVLSAIAITGIFFFTRGQSPADAGMEALRLAIKDERYTEARLSGGFDYSRYTGATRGEEASDQVLLDRAEIKAKAGAQEASDVDAKLVVARTNLARDTHKGANEAFAILDQLLKSGVETPEVLNDMGIAQLQLVNYDEAIGFFTRALAKSPNFDEALFNRAITYGRMHHREADARKDWQQFINQSSDENWKNEARTRLNGLSTIN